MTARSPLELRLHQIRIWIVVFANLAYLLYSLLTTMLSPDHGTLEQLFTGLHRTRYWGALLALSGMLAVWLWPARVKAIYTPYLLALLVVSVAEVQSLVANQTMPFHLALWLCTNMAVLFLVYGARTGAKVFGTMIFVILLALAASAPITGDLLIDWVTTLIVMTVSGATSYLLMTLIENNMLINERTINELRTARIDAVTGVSGRATIEEELQRRRAEARENQRPLSVVMTDIDHFKRVNDQYGHKLGDEVLREFAARLRRLVQPRKGVVGRWGGEEFLVLLPGHTYAQARAVAEELCRAVADLPVAGVDITASFGVASLLDDQTTAETLFTEADLAMYEAKRTGRNKVN